ncbi:O antigen biosynthesis rhamnosyltransferase rfbN [hydrothermal vent metagenome]|uniref:O antigen biosynthesis rhamnosyltransferase rfbN n=1 Tax=hydrothermal vent metagenome TaxID=652676 RepID=A0A1W1BL65_9ZZZZ
MSISVIIPTYNGEEYLPKLLEALKSQTVSFELIIIDSSSSDNTLNIAKKYADKIISIPQSEFDHGGTRTKAGKEAKGDILVFLTQDALPYNNKSIENIVKIFDNSHIGASYGRQLAYNHTNPFGTHLREFNYGTQSYIRELKDKDKFGIKTAFLSDSFASYRRTALEEINWIKDGLIVGEDSYAGAKLILKGYSLAYLSDAKVYHSHSYTIVQEFKRYFDIGVFHKREDWILKEFGKAEGEGGKYIKSEIKYLISNNLYHLIPQFFIRNGMKYLGYKLGQKYKLIPLKLIKKLSMHSFWWKV